MRDLMHQCLITTLNDGTADYQDTAGNPVASGIAVMVDRNTQHADPNGMFVVVPITVTWQKSQLPAVARGGRFVIGPSSFIVEDILSDDGQMVAASCLEAP